MPRHAPPGKSCADPRAYWAAFHTRGSGKALARPCPCGRAGLPGIMPPTKRNSPPEQVPTRETSMSDELFPVPAEWKKRAIVDAEKYRNMYEASVNDPESFWRREGLRIDWMKPYTKVKNTSFDPHNVSIKWFEDGTLNASVNCVDRHLEERGDQVAIIWEGDEPTDHKSITYRELHGAVCRFANVLKSQ